MLHIDAFSKVPNRGNPAGVVLEGAQYTEEEMQEIAREIGFNETVFVLESQHADYRLRYFTPGHEMNLCGHATMGAVYALWDAGMLIKAEFKIETNAGILPIQTNVKDAGLYITMQHAKPEFKQFTGSIDKLAASLGLSVEELDPTIPIVYGSTGIWTLIVPIRNLASFKKMKPQTEKFPEILLDKPKTSIHPICLEVRDAGNTMHARHFSSPFSGTVEDAVTGTGSGVMGAYYKKYIEQGIKLPCTLKVEQGHEIGKDGLVHVHLDEKDTGLGVSISGTAVFVKELKLKI